MFSKLQRSSFNFRWKKWRKFPFWRSNLQNCLLWSQNNAFWACEIRKSHRCQNKVAVNFLSARLHTRILWSVPKVMVDNILEPKHIWNSPHAYTVQNMSLVAKIPYKILKENAASGPFKNGFPRFWSVRALSFRNVNFIVRCIKIEIWMH